jgi:trigger factor
MQVTVEQQTPSQVELKVEVDVETVAKTIDQVYDEFSKRTNVPGFRKGKTPRKILERYVSPESVKRRAVELMVPTAFSEAIAEKEIQPYAEPDLQIVQFEAEQPFVFKATVPLPPKIELGEFKGIEVEPRSIGEVTDQDVEAQLKLLQESRATSQKVEDRGIRMGDIVIAEITSQVEGREKSQARRSMIEIGTSTPAFDQNLLDLRPEERRTFDIEYPADYSEPDLAGKKVTFDVAVEAIRERLFPEMNDEFAGQVGDFQTLDELREDIRARLIAAREQSADQEAERRVLEEIVARSKVDFPDVLVEHEVGHDLDEIQKRLEKENVSVGEYLRQIGKTREQFTADLREEAARRLKTGLVLGEIAEAEKIDVGEEEVEAEIERRAAESKATREAVEAYIEARGGRASLRNTLLHRKIMDFLRSVSTIK